MIRNVTMVLFVFCGGILHAPCEDLVPDASAATQQQALFSAPQLVLHPYDRRLLPVRVIFDPRSPATKALHDAWQARAHQAR